MFKASSSLQRGGGRASISSSFYSFASSRRSYPGLLLVFILVAEFINKPQKSLDFQLS